jgi:hypothetical protein
MGVSFGEEVRAPSIAPDCAQGDLAARVVKLEGEVAALRRAVTELRGDVRKIAASLKDAWRLPEPEDPDGVIKPVLRRLTSSRPRVARRGRL